MRSTLATKCLLGYVFAIQFVQTLYVATQVELPFIIEMLAPVTFVWLVWWWLNEDGKRSGLQWPQLDFGFFLAIAWIVVVPYHLFKTRGIKGFIGLAWYIGVLLAGWLTAAASVVVFLWN